MKPRITTIIDRPGRYLTRAGDVARIEHLDTRPNAAYPCHGVIVKTSESGRTRRYACDWTTRGVWLSGASNAANPPTRASSRDIVGYVGA